MKPDPGRFIEVNGVSLYVEEHGAGVPVLLMHGFPDSARLWRNQVPVLVGNGFRVITPDMRGFGRSGRPQEVAAYRLQNVVADVTGLLDAFGIQAAHVVGHDWGAAVAWLTATLTPDRVRSLVVISVPHPLAPVTLRQHEMAWYQLFFQFAGVAEATIRADDWAWLRMFSLGDGDIGQWIEELSRPGQLLDPLADVPVAPAEHPQPRPVIGPDGRLGDVGELEEQLIPGHLVLPQGDRRERVRHRDDHEAAHPVRGNRGREPRHRRAPVMADDVCRLDAEGVQQPGHVRHHVLQPVGGDLLRAAGPAESAQVRRDHPETVTHQDRHLIAPEPRGIGETVHEQHRDADAVLLDVQGYAVDLDEPPWIRFHILSCGLSGRAIERFAYRDVKRAEQGGELAVEVDAHLGDRGEAEAGNLRAGLVGGEERAVIGAGVDDGAQRHVQHDRRVVPVHLLGDGVVAHEIGGAPRGVTGQAHQRRGVEAPEDEEADRKSVV